MPRFTVFYVWYEENGDLHLDGVKVRGKRLQSAKAIIDREIKAEVDKGAFVVWPVKGYLNTNTDTFHFE